MEDNYSPQLGDILLCYDKTWYDHAIDAVEEFGLIRQGVRPPIGRPIYSHTAVFVGNGYVIEAMSNGLVRTPVFNYFGKADVWSKDVEGWKRQRIANKAEKMLRQGYKYAWWDIAVQFVYLVFGVRILWHSLRSIIGSVFGFDCWAAIGQKIAKYRNCCPEDIAVFGTLQFKGPL